MFDMFYFFLILFVFITAYGLASQAMLYPNAELNAEIVPAIWEKAYFQIYGELFLEELKGLKLKPAFTYKIKSVVRKNKFLFN